MAMDKRRTGDSIDLSISDAANAGASFMPPPTMAVAPSFFQFSKIVAFQMEEALHALHQIVQFNSTSSAGTVGSGLKDGGSASEIQQTPVGRKINQKRENIKSLTEERRELSQGRGGNSHTRGNLSRGNPSRSLFEISMYHYIFGP